ncbi:uncharacterized protein G2W53_009926 [Senna tora]|uniref:Uncharacterized protein n=2 Tax=Senna tora TaxID=362788 RepID=A0A835CDG3_9FABA|nr:uncharacterized protein G2W53_009926 [Senna tora]
MSETRRFPFVFANRSGFDAPIGVVMAWEERGSCLNIFWTTNRGQIFETFTNSEAKHLCAMSETRWFALYLRTRVDLMFQLESSRHGRSVDDILTYSGRQIGIGSDKPSRITRQNTCCAIVMAWEERGSYRNIFRTTNLGRISETFTNYEAEHLFRKSDFDAPIGVIMAREGRGSCLNIFWTKNRGRISETFTNFEAKHLLRKNLHELRGKTLVAQVCESRRFTLKLRTGVVLMFQLESSWQGRGVDHILTYSGRQIASDLRNCHKLRGRTLVAETRPFALYLRTRVVLMLQLESSWHGRSVDHVLTYSERKLAVGSQKPSRITRQHNCCASVLNTSDRVVFANRSGFDAQIGVVMAWEKCG